MINEIDNILATLAIFGKPDRSEKYCLVVSNYTEKYLLRLCKITIDNEYMKYLYRLSSTSFDTAEALENAITEIKVFCNMNDIELADVINYDDPNTLITFL